MLGFLHKFRMLLMLSLVHSLEVKMGIFNSNILITKETKTYFPQLVSNKHNPSCLKLNSVS